MYLLLRNVFTFVSILAFSFVIAIPATHAQSGEGIEIKPAIIEDRAERGQVYDFTIHVTNLSDSQKVLYLSAQDIKGLNNEGLPIFSDETEVTPYELSTWIHLPSDSITIAPRETKSVPYTVRVPADATPGAHFGGVFLDARPPQQRENGSVVAMKVGTIINLRIAGDVHEEAQLREFSSGKIVYGTAANIAFNAKIANLGNVLLRPHGLVEITDMRGSKVGIVKINDNGAGIFPGEDKIFNGVWEYDGVAFGRYQAVISLVYGEDERKTVSAVTSFWVLPLKPILSILGTIFAVLFVLYVFVRMYIARKLKEMGGGKGDLYAKRNRSPVPGLLVVALALLFLAIAFLVLLFVMFA